LRSIYPELKEYWGASGSYLSGERFVGILQKILPDFTDADLARLKASNKFEGVFSGGSYLNRLQVSILLDEILDPFSKEIDWKGELK
jgi:hypothetical protein